MRLWFTGAAWCVLAPGVFAQSMSVPDPLAAIGVRFPEAVRVETTIYPSEGAAPSGRDTAELRPRSVMAQLFQNRAPMGMMPVHLRYDTEHETIMFDPAAQRATRMTPFLSTVGMSAIESQLAPYGFVRLIRWQAARGDAVKVRVDGRETVIEAPTPGRGRPSVEVRVDTASQRITRIIARGGKTSTTTYEFFDYRTLPDGSAFPFRYTTVGESPQTPTPFKNLVVYDKVEVIDPLGVPERPVFGNAVVIDDTIDNVVTDGTGNVLAQKTPIAAAPRTMNWNHVTVGAGVAFLMLGAVAWRIRRRA
jgi:hypothetical protein